MYGEECGSPHNITQIPFENLLDMFNLFVTDFYDKLNKESEITCYQEFGSFEIENIRKLRGMIGKRIYAVAYDEDGEEYYKIITEDCN